MEEDSAKLVERGAYLSNDRAKAGGGASNQSILEACACSGGCSQGPGTAAENLIVLVECANAGAIDEGSASGRPYV